MGVSSRSLLRFVIELIVFKRLSQPDISSQQPIQQSILSFWPVKGKNRSNHDLACANCSRAWRRMHGACETVS